MGSAVSIDRDGACGRLILYPALAFGREADLQGVRALAAKHPSRPATTLVVVGGNEEFGRSAFRAAAPLRTLHVDDDGAVREVRRRFQSQAPRLVIENALDRLAVALEDGTFPSLDFETARGLVSSGPQDEFRPPLLPRGVVTTALTAAIILCFVVEVMIGRDALKGEGATMAIAYRMGAIYRATILEGEWQRLIAAPFLHFGFLHLAMNGWAQWSLGTPIEFLVGSPGFLALWVLSALGASLTSLIFNESSVAAGASGAIFGLLGAFTTFVFFRRDVLPQPAPRALRNGVLATILLNVMISFIPGIDMAAHAGGFLTGALVAFGLRRERPMELTPRRVLGLRLAVGGLVLTGVGVTAVQNRADLSLAVPQIAGDYRVGDLRLPVPEGFVASESRAKGLTTIELDGGPASPFSVIYKVSEPQSDEPAALRVLRSLRSKEAPPGPSDWIALSRLGVQNLRAIEIVVVSPSSCRDRADSLGSALASGIR